MTANKTISDIFIAKLSTCAMNKYQLYLHITFTIGNMPTVATLISDGLCSGPLSSQYHHAKYLENILRIFALLVMTDSSQCKDNHNDKLELEL